MIRLLSMLLVAPAILHCGEDRPPPPPPPPGFVPGQTPVPIPGQPQPIQPGVPGIPAPATITLTPGFMPDPQVVRGTSGGAVQASNLSPGCTGWIGQNPNHLVNVASPFTNLRVIVAATGGQDTTLVVQKPDGTYVCDDDSEGMNPIVQGPITTAGVHRVWVGSYTRTESIPYTLGFSELTSVTAASLIGGTSPTPTPTPTMPATIDITGTTANFAPVNVAPGFVPDPMVVSGTSGGAESATSLGSGCIGFIATTPDHFLQVGGAGIPSLRVMAKSETDTTIVVRRPDGTFMCNDDSDGFNPMVEGNFPPGQYRVWIGSYAQGQNGSYRLGVSAQAGMTPSRLQ